MIQTLSRFYRHSLADAPAASVTLADELALQRHYLDIEAVRFPDRLVVAFDTEEAVLTARVPGMILQPLVENAVKYGVAASTRPVTVTVSAKRQGDMLMLEVCDDGTGASDNAPSVRNGSRDRTCQCGRPAACAVRRGCQPRNGAGRAQWQRRLLHHAHAPVCNA